MTVEQFIEEYEKPNKPVILTDLMTNWGAMKNWTREKLLKNYGDIIVRFLLHNS